MTDRDVLLQQKALSITRYLERWAKREGILKPGERISGINLSITCVVADNFLEMPPCDFFTLARFHEAGVPTKYHFTRIKNLLANCDRATVSRGHGNLLPDSWTSHRCIDLPTLRHVLAAGKIRLSKVSNSGKKTVEAMAQVLAYNGMTLTKYGE